MVACALDACMKLLLAFLFSKIMDAAVALNMHALLVLMGLGAGVTIGMALTQFLFEFTRAYWIRRCNLAVKADLFHAIVGSDLNTFNAKHSVTYISILNNDTKQLELNYFLPIATIINAGVLYVFAAGGMFALNVWAALFAIVVNALPLLPPMLFGQPLIHSQKTVSEAQEAYTVGLKDAFAGLEVVKSFGAERHLLHHFAADNARVEGSFLSLRKLTAYYSGVIVFIGEFSFIATMLFLTWLVLSRQISIGLMMAGIQLTNYFVNPLQQIALGTTSLKSVRAIKTRMSGVFDMAAQPAKARVQLQRATPIALKDIIFGYQPGKPVLKGLSFTFETGKKYAIVGATGCGKSTMMKLLMQYYADYSGQITFAGQDARAVDKASLYKQAAMIHQNIVLFTDSLRNNITLFDAFLDEDIQRAAADAGLSAFIARFADGLDAPVDENGKNFSGGERQRIAIARAFLRGTAWLLSTEHSTSCLAAKATSTISTTSSAVRAASLRRVTSALSAYCVWRASARHEKKNGLTKTEHNRLCPVFFRSHMFLGPSSGHWAATALSPSGCSESENRLNVLLR
ncbi:MAG: ABC transporter ATP-binding protein [Sporolactobacillus sp.]